MERKSAKIKILFTIPNFDTAGSGKALLKIATNLDKEIFEPHIACLHSRGEYFNTVQNTALPVHVFDYSIPLRPVHRLLLKAYKVSRKFKKLDIDIIHSFNYSSDYSEPLAAKLAGIKWIFTKKNMSWAGHSKNSWKLRSSLADGIAVQNTDMIKKFYPDSKKIKLIPRGVDINEFYPRKRKESLAKELNVENSKVILCVANLVPVKGVEVLVSAFYKLKTENKKLLIVGDDSSEYAQGLKRENADDINIIFTGKRFDIKDLHSIADVFVLPTLNKGRQEGSPVSLLEAMASGVPVLASNIAGIRDQLADLKNNLFEPGDSDELAGKLKYMLESPQEMTQGIINKQLNIIKNKYNLQLEVTAHQELYLKVLSK
jgi:glycosyltransferase involved in cell wall biosynthesis